MINSAYLNLALIIIALVPYFAIGRLFGVKKFFLPILVGLSFSALAVGLLSNFCAGLIRPFILVSMILGLVLLVKDFKKYNFKENLLMYLFLGVIALIIFIFNDPIKIFINDQILLFNQHYSYYANQPTEMLNARYFSRLQVAQFMPIEWSRYHFFNASAQASVQGLILHPNILTYFFAELVISILGLLAILENFLDEFGFNLKTVLISLIWTIVGFTIFANSIAWNLMTTGTLTVPAMVLVLISAYKKDVNSFIIFTLILGVSAFRILPLSLILLALLVIYLFKTAKATSFIAKVKQTFKMLVPNILFFFGYLFFVFYNLATVILGKPIDGSMLSSANAQLFYYSSWIYPLASYKIAGLLVHLKGGSQIFSQYKAYGYVNADLNPRILFAILVIFGLISAVFLIRLAISAMRKRPVLFWCIMPLLLLAIIPFWFSLLDLKFLLILTLPYLVFALALLNYIARSPREKTRFFILYIWLFVTAVILQFSGLNLAQKAPLLWVVCDIALWGILGLFLFSRVKRYPHIVFFLIIALMLIPVFNFHLKGMLAIDEKTSIDLKPLSGVNFTRKFFVSPTNNFCNFNFDNPTQADAYSTLLGCNLNFNEENKGFISYEFIKPR
jgi:hypothetical protein